MENNYIIHHGIRFGVVPPKGFVGPFSVKSPYHDHTEYASSAEAMDMAKQHYARFLAEQEVETRAKWIPPMLYSEGTSGEIIKGIAVPFYDGLPVTLCDGIFRQVDGTAIPMPLPHCDHGSCGYCKFNNTQGELYTRKNCNKTVEQILQSGEMKDRDKLTYHIMNRINLKSHDRFGLYIGTNRDIVEAHTPIGFNTQEQCKGIVKKWKGGRFVGMVVFEQHRRYEPSYKGYISDAARIIRF